MLKKSVATKRVLSLLMAILMVLSVLSPAPARTGITKAQAADMTATADSWKALRDAINNAPENKHTVITITQNITANSADVSGGTMKIGGPKTIELKGPDGASVKILRKDGDADFQMFLVDNDAANLILGSGITLSGSLVNCVPGTAGTVASVPGTAGFDSVTPGQHRLEEYEQPPLGDQYFAFLQGGSLPTLTTVSYNDPNVNGAGWGYEYIKIQGNRIVSVKPNEDTKTLVAAQRQNFVFRSNVNESIDNVVNVGADGSLTVPNWGSPIIWHNGGLYATTDKNATPLKVINGTPLSVSTTGSTPSGGSGTGPWVIPAGGTTYTDPEEAQTAVDAINLAETVWVVNGQPYYNLTGAQQALDAYNAAHPSYWTVNNQGNYPTQEAAQAAANAMAGQQCDYNNQTCPDGDKVYTKNGNGGPKFEGGSSDSPRGFFAEVTKGTITLRGAVLEHFNTSREADKTPKHVAPVVAKGGTSNFNIESGEIRNNIVGYIANDNNSGWNANAIKQYVKGGAPNAKRVSPPDRRWTYPSLDITGTAGAIIYANGATGTISGGNIAYNRADTGGVMVSNDAFVTIKNNADINHNIGVQFGGGTTVENGGSIYMDGGKINDNIAWFGGGAVFATENGIKWLTDAGVKKEDRKGGNFTMAGGELAGNSAFTRGGAILVDSNGVALLGGIIHDNTSRMLGGAAYVMGDHPDYSYTLYIEKGEIYNNEAVQAKNTGNGVFVTADPTVTQTPMSNKIANVTNCTTPGSLYGEKATPASGSTDDTVDPYVNGQAFNDGTGGGVWVCAYGSTVLDLDSNKVWIHDNKAYGATGNPALISRKDKKLANEMNQAPASSGGKDFHSDNGGDGTLLMLNASPSDWLDENTGKKYDPGNPSETDGEIRNLTFEGTGSYNGGVKIYNNASRRGGGLAADGTFVFGQNKDVARVSASLVIEKVWEDGVEKKPVIIEVSAENTSGQKALVQTIVLDGNPNYSEIESEYELSYEGNKWIAGFGLPATLDDENGKRMSLFKLVGPKGTYDPKDPDSMAKLAEDLKGTNGSGFSLSSDVTLKFNELVDDGNGNFVSSNQYKFEPGAVQVEKLELTIKTVQRVNAQGVTEPVLSVSFTKVPLRAPVRNEAPSEEVPGPEKYINKVVHTSLPAFDKIFEYAVLAYVPKDATEVVLTDTLEKPLEFVNQTKQTVLSGFYVLAENDHKGDGNGTVATTPRDKVEGNTLRVANGVKNGSRPGIDLKLDGNTVTLTLKEQFLQGIETSDNDAIFKKEGKGRDGVWVMMTFDAQYKKDYYDLAKVKDNEQNGDSWLEDADDKSGGAALTYVQNNAEVRQNANTNKYIIKLGDKYYNSSDAKTWADVTKDASYYIHRWDGNGDPKFNKLEGSAILDVTGIAIPDEAGITANGFVKDGNDPHSGTKNQAEYKLTRGNNPASEYKTNIVTVDAPMTKLEAEKKWKNAAGSDITWPEGVKVEVDVIKVDNATQAEEKVDTIELTAGEPKKQSKELPKLNNATYRLEEVTVDGYTTASAGMEATDLTEGSESGKVFTNTKNDEEKPEIEKFVKEAVHKDITFDEEFTYDIVAYVTKDAEKVTITDTLNAVLEFVTAENEVAVYDLGESNNHKVTYDVQAKKVNSDATVAGGTAYEGAVCSIDDQTLTVTIEDATALQGHWIKVRFTAKIKDGLTIADLQKEGVYREVKGNKVNDFDVDRAEPNNGNAPVKAGATHTGVPNKAEYVITVNNEAKYKDTSNTVTVKPSTEVLTITKKWVNDDAATRPTEEELKLALKVAEVKNGEATLLDPQPEAEITDNGDDTWTVSWKNLPKKTGVSYQVDEAYLLGYIVYGAPAVNGGTITNTKIDQKGNVKVNKYIKADGTAAPQRLAGAKLQILDAARNVVYPVGATLDSTADGNYFTSKGDAATQIPIEKPGTYYLHEVEAPAGYEKAKDVEFEVVAGEEIDLTATYIGKTEDQGGNTAVPGTPDYAIYMQKQDGTLVLVGATSCVDPKLGDPMGAYKPVTEDAYKALTDEQKAAIKRMIWTYMSDATYKSYFNGVSWPNAGMYQALRVAIEKYLGKNIDDPTNNNSYGQVKDAYDYLNEQAAKSNLAVPENLELFFFIPDSWTDTAGTNVTYGPQPLVLLRLVNGEVDMFDEKLPEEEIPEIEKYVNKRTDVGTDKDGGVHTDLEAFDEVYTYDIQAYIAKDATLAEITDELKTVLEFVGKASSVKVVVKEGEADGKAPKLSKAGKAPEDKYTVDETAWSNGKLVLTLGVAGSTEVLKAAGQWIQITFDAKIKDAYRSIDALKAAGANVWETVTDNAPIDDATVDASHSGATIDSHEGIANDASYKMKKAGVDVDNTWSYSDESNTVTVQPKTEDLEITKVWVGDKAEDRPSKEAFIAALSVIAVKETPGTVGASDGNGSKVSYAGEPEITDNGDNTWTAKWTGLPKLEGVTYKVAETQIPGYDVPAGSPAANKGTITNTKETPEIEKYVNKKDATPEQRDGTVHTDLSFFDEVYTYDIQAYVTKDAKYVVVTDQLVEVLELVNANGIKIVAKNGAGADGKTAPALSSAEGSVDVKAQCTMDLGTGTANKLVFTFGSENSTTVLDFAGQWLQITFDAKIKDEYRSIEALKDKGVSVWTTIDKNEPVDDADTTTEFSGATAGSHEGIINEASYTINKKAGAGLGNEWQYEDKSNTVTVQPKTTEVKVKKLWQNADGSEMAWPAGVTATVKLLKNGNPALDDNKQEITLTLNKANPEGSFQNLPVLENVEYTVEEIPTTVDGKPYMAIQSTDEKTGLVTITNKPEEPELEKYVNKDVTWDFENFDQVFTYDIMAYVTMDADTLTITDSLNKMLEIAKPSNLKIADMGTSNDHKDVVKNEGTPIALTDAKEAVAEDGNVKVVIEDLEGKNLRGHWIKVSYDARISEEAYAAVAKLILDRAAEPKNPKGDMATVNNMAWVNITDNGTVDIKTSHDGIPNKAHYELTVKNNGSHKLDSNTVTVEPKTTEIQVKKVWAGEAKDFWPEDTTVTFGLYQDKDGHEEPVMGSIDQDGKFTLGSKAAEVVLNKDKKALTITGLPLLEGVKYIAREIKVNEDVVDYNREKTKGVIKEAVSGAVSNVVVYFVSMVQDLTPEKVLQFIATNAPMTVEKYVEKDVTYDFENFDQVFEYEILGFVPADAVKAEFTDTLVEALEFVGQDANIKVYAMGTENNHVDTVAGAGTVITKGFTKSASGKELKVTFAEITDETGIRSQWVKVTFEARITKDAYDKVAAKIAEKHASEDEKAADVAALWENISNNGTVLIDKAHDGVPNKASMTIGIEQGGVFTKDTNTVTVEPKTTKVEVSKEWMTGTQVDAWPAGAEVEVKLTQTKNGVTTDVKGKTETLTASKTKVTFADLPCLEGVTYGVAEGEVIKPGQYVIGQVEEVEEGVFKITNKKETPEIEKYVNKKDDEGTEKDGGVHTDLDAFNEVYTYDIQAYITKDATLAEITDELKTVLEFVGEASSVKVVVKDGEADGKAPKLSKAGEAPEDSYTVDEDAWKAGKLVLTLGDADSTEVLKAAGQWIQITFDAKIKDAYRSIDALKKAGADVWETVTDNAPIDDATVDASHSGATIDSHEGIANDASYKMKKFGVDVDNTWSYSDKSNTVTVQPETTTVWAKKTWQDEKGNVAEWPEDVESVTVNVWGEDTEKPVATITLTDGNAVESEELPVLENVEYTVDEVAIPGYTEVAEVTGTGTEADPYVFTNKKNGGPQIEKYVNNNVHQNLVEFDKLIKYDIIVFVPEDADELVISDELVGALEFADGTRSAEEAAVSSQEKTKVVTSVVVKETNDHTVNGTVKGTDGTALGKAATVTVSGKELKVAVANAEPYRGKFIQVTFWAKYTQDTIEAAKVDNSKKVNGNGAVLGGAKTHTGTPNDASYKISVDNVWSSDHKSNTVTVEAETTKLEAEKQWKNADGTTTWPEGVAEVQIDVKNGDTVVDTIVLTAEKAKNTSKELPKLIGVEYKLAEVEVPGYTTTVEGTVFTNTEITHEVKISKTDLGGVELEGAHIVVRDSEGNDVDGWVSTKDAHKLALVPGTYTMEETVAPAGYRRVTTIIEFTVDAEGIVTRGTTEVDNGGRILKAEGEDNHLILQDAPVKVVISKEDLSGHELDGAEITVTGPEGFEKSWVSKADEPHVLKNLKPGEYELKETVAPDGFELVTTIKFAVDEDGNVTVTNIREDNGGGSRSWDTEEATHIVVEDAPKKPEIEKYVNDDVHANLVEFDKEFKYDIIVYVPGDADEIEINDTLVNAIQFVKGKEILVSYKTENDHKVNGSVAKAGNALGKDIAAVTVEGQKLSVKIADAKAYRGQYIQVTFWAEYTEATIQAAKVLDAKTVTDNGAVLGGVTPHEGTANDASYKIIVDNVGSSEHKSNTVTVEAETTTLEAEKKWENADGSTTWPEDVEKVEIQVLNGTEVVDTIILTKDQPKASSKELPKLKDVVYALAEVEIDGYITEVDDTGTVFTNRQSGTEEPVPVKINKTDMGGNEVEGAVIVVKDAAGKVVTDADGNEVGIWTSRKEETLDLELEPGTYTMEETVAPKGYKQVTTAIEFEVKEDGTVEIKTTEVVNGKVKYEDGVLILMDEPEKPEPVQIKINKTDMDGEEVAGAKIQVWDADGINLIDSWTSVEGETFDLTLEPGDYVLVEVSAPEGYLRVETEISFSVDEDGIITVNTLKVEPAGAAKVIDGVLVLMDELDDTPVEDETETPSVPESTEPTVPDETETIPNESTEETEPVEDESEVPTTPEETIPEEPVDDESETPTTPEVPSTDETEPEEPGSVPPESTPETEEVQPTTEVPTEPSQTAPTTPAVPGTTPPSRPDTGDHSNIGLYIGLLGFAAVGTGLLVATRRKKEEE